MCSKTRNGFTLIELLIAMAITSIVMTAIVSVYHIQIKGKRTQEVLTDMNQTARAAQEIMINEIRMAGCDPAGNSNARIIEADAMELVFSLDIDNDAGANQADGDCCDPNEVIRYQLTNDADNDGINDNIANVVQCDLGRETGAGNDPQSACGGAGVNGLQAVARNVDALNFVYLDSDGNVLSTPVADPDDIRRIELTLVARAGEVSGGLLFSYANTNTYQNQQDDVILPPQNDSFRRLLLTTTVNLRNIGR
ncbi:type IV pilus assembly protein PilW [Desulfosalsimonas propionicica]|uniref:Type IV pilus assembly protein PilW n=1 Tax=Desulfosalsimonas propionicica TaxID=332175 RepID=A0A7W0HJV7_9BACT|nr:prepilin-type N-terminal cleavage/methylation domain-containing protein [Desulfosalsimonas propionicica]MBA2880639.1 type IV pilus assembly protein PilW [Desulfosalsimonas propionicica]